MRDLYVKNGDGFVLVYSITSQSTFNDVNEFYERIMRVKDTELHVSSMRTKSNRWLTNICSFERIFLKGQPPLILVGNKSDLEDERVVGREHGQALARKWRCSFLETSAKDRANVNEVNIDFNRRKYEVFLWIFSERFSSILFDKLIDEVLRRIVFNIER